MSAQPKPAGETLEGELAPAVPVAQTNQADQATGADSGLQPEDFYFEGPYMVFTAEYHRKRGYCCNSDCRHCPYR